MDLLDELRTQIVRQAGEGAERKIQLSDGVFVAYAPEPTEPVAVMSEPSVAVVGSGVKRTVLNGIPYDYHAGRFLVVSLDLPVVGQALVASKEEPLVVFSMTLKPAAIAALLPELPPAAERPALTGLAVSDATPALLDPIVRLLRLADDPGDLGVLGPGLQVEILWRLLNGPQGRLVRQIGEAGDLAAITATIRWMREHYREPVRVRELAALATMSPSTFHRHFRAATSMSPIQFQKQVRLQEARALLATRPATVAEVAYWVGYQSPSQFTRDYRRVFGSPPGADRPG